MSDMLFNNTFNNNTAHISIEKIASNKIYSYPSFSQVLEISSKMWILFIIGHFSIGFFIMYKDLKGSWEKYKLVQEDKKTNKLHKYYLCIPYLIRDLLFLLPIFLSIYVFYSFDFIKSNFEFSELLIEFFIKFPLAYIIRNIWDMLVHRLWHQIPFLYNHVHKEHHINIREMCSLSAWRDSWLEFIFEIPGTFLIGPFFMKMNWISHALLISSMGFISSIDHSGFYVNYFIDSRYHFNHHNKPNSNFADIKILDNFFGAKLHE